MEDTYFMDEALALAREAAADGEVPVGCVIVRGDTIVGRGRNRRETDKSALAHAEIEAIGEACRRLGGWRLWECTLYVTLEPCPLCAGAIINPGGLRRFRPEVRRCGFGVQSVFHGVQSSPASGKRRPGSRVRGAADGIFP